MKPKACIIIEHISGNVRECTFELASFPMMDFFRETHQWNAVIAGHEIKKLASLFAEKTGLEVIAIQNHALENFSGEGYLHAYISAITENNVSLVLTSHTPLGCDVAPALAISMGMQFLSSVQKIFFKNGNLIAMRERMNGKIIEEIPITEPAVCTIMPGAIPVSKSAVNPGRVSVYNINIDALKSLPGVISCSQKSASELTDAEVVVSAGRGVKKLEHMEHLHMLTSLFPRAAIGGSRAACDMGLVDYSFQIGMTGRSVSPKLYFACGISGSAQHIAGMKNSRTIVAINRDESAPIFQIADVGVVDEVEKFIPEFVKLVREN